MADEQGNSGTEQAAVAKTEQVATQTKTDEGASAKKEASQILAGGQGKDAPTLKDYQEAVRAFNEKARELADLKKRQDSSEQFQKKVEQTFGTQTTIQDSGETPSTPAELRAKAKDYRNAGDADTAKLFEGLAIQQEKIDRFEANNQMTMQMSELFEELSRDDSPIKPTQVDWKKIGEIAGRERISARAALGTYITDNFKGIVNPLLEQTKKTAIDSLGARGFDSDYEPKVTDEEKQAIEKERASIGDPRKWPKK